MIAKQHLWIHTAEDNYENGITRIPSLLPVFDPAFTSTPDVDPTSALNDPVSAPISATSLTITNITYHAAPLVTPPSPET